MPPVRNPPDAQHCGRGPLLTCLLQEAKSAHCPCRSLWELLKLGATVPAPLSAHQLRAFALTWGSTLEEPTDLEDRGCGPERQPQPVFRQEVFTGRVLEGAVPGEPGGSRGGGALPWGTGGGQKSRISRQ